MAARLRESGFDPEPQWLEPRPGIRSATLMARLPRTECPDVTNVAGFHFHPVDEGFDAGDDSSGTTAPLETARMPASRPQPTAISDLVRFIGQEAGLLGSREHARLGMAEGWR